jgi:hypothetical protein
MDLKLLLCSRTPAWHMQLLVVGGVMCIMLAHLQLIGACC